MTWGALGPFFSYYGAKNQAGHLYPSPDYDTVIEPFCGSAGYSLLYPDRNVRLYDKDDRIVALWQWLIQATPDEVLEIPLFGPSIRTTRDIPGPDAVRHLVGFWANPASAMPKVTPTPRSKWNWDTRQRISRQVNRIKHWTCELVDSYADIPNCDATWYVDPPYQQDGKWYRHSADNIDFHHLGQWCRDRLGQVIVCENEGADWLPFRFLGRINAMAGTSREVIYTQGCDVPIQERMFA